MHFIDLAFADFFAGRGSGFPQGARGVSRRLPKRTIPVPRSPRCREAQQHAYLASVEQTPFFGWLRFLTVAGLLASPKYGGNKDGLGWKLIGFEDSHVFTPPFGYYDRDYPGFVPYTDAGKQDVTARRFRPEDMVDFAVVGSGAAGGVMARELSQAGFSVVLFEQGPYWHASDWEHDEFKYWVLNGIVNDPSQSPQTFRRDPQQQSRAGARYQSPLLRASRRRQQRAFHRELLALSRDRLHRAQPARRDLGDRPSTTGRSPTRNSSPTTPRSNGKSASPASRARVLSTRRAPSPTRCRRCR